MKVPVGFLATLWSFFSFLPFFFFLLILGLAKAAIIGPIALGIIVIGNSAVIIGLWIAHFLYTYYCVARTKRLGFVLKIAVLLLLPVPLVLWPVIGIGGSLLGGIGYGFFAPLLATFEAVGENVKDKFYHCFADGCLPTIKGTCTVVCDFTDFCFHSYFSYMDELCEKVPPEEKPMDVKLAKLPSCLLVILIAVPVDVLLITAVALWKSPYMLFRGWKRLLEDLIGREGPFLETVCVPFAGLAIILWPLAVLGAVIGAIISSFFLALYSGVIVHQEDSLLKGLGYILALVSLFDEYVNDFLYLREGSCLPRPRYRKNANPKPGEDNSLKTRRENSLNAQLISQKSRTLKWEIQPYKAVQVWDWLFKACEVNGRILLRDGLINIQEIEECLVKGNCKKLSIKLPTWSVLHCLLVSAKSDSSGLVISDDVELARNNGPREKVFEWLIEPLLIMKEQIKNLKVEENEETCLKRLVIECENKRPEEWDGTGFPSNDNVRRAQLQAIIRRLQGIVASMSRFPTFRRRFRNMLKVLYVEAIQAGASASHIGVALKSKYTGKSLIESGSGEGRNETDEVANEAFDNGDVV
ncbi:hypothetical protein Peur_021619 [Populus x canadensis]|uniref:uncharacterized membrane protein At3g27390 isoform X2 n=1 Tax=Populus nigra TaxID=3691 RepID=UPI002B265D0D|nr:uncharacterized membrane protein At3g27390 isoform X2 [Populus nigra]